MRMVTKSLALVLLAVPSVATAQAREDRTRTMEDVIACRAVREDAARLACFDRASEKMAGARASGELLVLDRKTVVARKQQRFGLASPGTEMFGGGDADAATEVKQLDSNVVATVAAKAYGRYDMQLANGSVWQSVDPLPYPPKAGTAITIKAAPLGAYRASIAGGRSILVKRIR